MCVVDIGANIGCYALLEARLVGNQGKVLAIEPVPTNNALLKRNIIENGFQNVQVCEFAIGHQNDTSIMYLSNSSNLCSLVSNQESNGLHVTVNVKTLDSVLINQDRVDYIQMDMEGYETKAIYGMINVLKKYHPSIFIELHPRNSGGNNIINLVRQLKELGYIPKYVVNKAYNYPMACRVKNCIETPTIDELLNDNRLINEKAALNVFFTCTRA
jgi:FkbM family methyltransferase